MEIPLLDISERQQLPISKDKESNYEKAGIFSRITFFWIFPLIKVL